MVFSELVKNWLQNKIQKFNSDKDLSELINGSATTLIIRLMGNAVGFLLMFLITTGYGENGAQIWGEYLLVVLVLRMFVIGGRFGADTALLRFVANFNAKGLKQNVRKVYKTALQLVIPIALLLSASMYFSAPFIAEKIEGVQVDNLQWLALFVLPFSWFFINTQCLRGLKNMKAFSFFFNTSVSTFSLLLLASLFFVDKQSFLGDVNWPLYAFAFGVIVSFFLSLFWWINSSKGDGYKEEIDVKTKQFLSTSAPLLLAQSITFIMGWTDQLMLGAMIDAEEVGIYGVAFKYSTLAVIFLMAINSISAPKFAEFHGSNDIKGLEKTVKHSTKMIFWSTLPIVLVFCLLPEFFLGITGEQFRVASFTLILLMFGRFYSAISGSVGNILQMTGHQVIVQNIMLVAAAINVILNLLLIPICKMEGAAIASLVSVIFWNTAMVIVVKRKFGFYSIYIPGLKV